MSKIELANLLHSQIKTTRINRTRLAAKANISRQTLYKLLNAEIEEARLSTIVKLSTALKLHPTDVLRVYFNGSSLSNGTSDNSGFIGDVTYPDNSIVTINETFTKVWAVRNTGQTPWRNWQLICMDQKIQVSAGEENFSVSPERGLTPLCEVIDIPETLPGKNVELSVTFKAPPYPCTTISYWKSTDEQGNLVFPEREGLSCLVNVVAL